MSSSQNQGLGPSDSQIFHIYKQGESLVEISIAHGVSVEDLCTANGLTEHSMLFPGQRLKIPSQIVRPPNLEKPTSHVVSSGDSLAEIADRYEISLVDLQAFNNLKSEAILFPGSIIKLTPPPTQIAVESTKAPKHCLIHGYHKVKAGDQLARIAAFHGVSTQALLSANNLGWNSIISPGTKLVIPISHSALTCPSIVPLSQTSQAIVSELVEIASTLGLPEFAVICALCLEMQRSGLLPEMGNRQLIQKLLADLQKVESIDSFGVREALLAAGYSELAEGASLWEPSAWAWLHHIRSNRE